MTKSVNVYFSFWPCYLALKKKLKSQSLLEKNQERSIIYYLYLAKVKNAGLKYFSYCPSGALDTRVTGQTSFGPSHAALTFSIILHSTV